MPHERPEACPVAGSSVFAQPGDTAAHTVELDELLNENKRLRDIVIFLSEIIIRNALART